LMSELHCSFDRWFAGRPSYRANRLSFISRHGSTLPRSCMSGTAERE
jgi:hypothetical protein